MGTLIGLGLGLGLALIAWARIEPVRPPRRPARKSRLAQMLSAAGIVRLTAGRLVALCAALGAGCAVVSLGLTGVPAMSNSVA